MGMIIKGLLGLFTGGASTAGGAVANVAAWVALIAALTPAALWLMGHKDVVFVSVTYGEAGFWGTIIGVLVFVMVKLAYRAPPPGG